MKLYTKTLYNETPAQSYKRNFPHAFIISVSFAPMKSAKKHCVFLVAGLALMYIACSKGSQATALPATRFTWSFKGTTHSGSQFTASLYSLGTYLIIGAQGNTIRSFPQCNFSLTSFSKGAYVVNSTRLNILRYVDDSGDALEASTGQVNITAYGNDVISGDFSAMLQTPSGGSVPISGSFVNIPVTP